MNRVKNTLRKIRWIHRPSRAFKRATWAMLELEFEHVYPSSVGVWRKTVAVSAMVLVLFTTTGTGVYAYSSPQVTESHVLYSVKHGMEAVEQVFPRPERRDIDFYMRMMDRRISEGEVLIEQDIVPVNTLERAGDRLAYILEHLSDEEAEEVLDILNAKNDRYMLLMNHYLVLSQEQEQEEFDRLRNNMEDIRVWISESELHEEHKEALRERFHWQVDSSRESPPLRQELPAR